MKRRKKTILMPKRSKITFSEEELSRPVNLIMCVSDRILDLSSVDIEEAGAYVEKHGRRALIVSSASGYDSLPTVNYQAVMNANKVEVKRVDTNDDPYQDVYRMLGERFKNGLIVCGRGTHTNEIISNLASRDNTGIDLLIQRQDLLKITDYEKKHAGFIRIHYRKDFSFSQENLTVLSEIYGQNNAFGIMICQHIANYQYHVFTDYVSVKGKELIMQGWDNFNDLDGQNRQCSWYVYFDRGLTKIYGIDLGNFRKYVEDFLEVMQMQVPEDGEKFWDEVHQMYMPF